MKNQYIRNANYEISRILTLLDRNKYSETYGSFDRNYWHYKIKDFSSGMSQEFTLALALAFTTSYDGNYFQNPFIKEYVEAGIEFTINSSRKDGSTDDYFPYERALGAAVFSLYAVTEAYLLLNLNNKIFIDFFRKRAKWICENEESGKLSNHHAIAALALHNVFLISKEEEFKKTAKKKIEQVISWQTDEGWYQEYEGCSLGYLSVSIDFLAQYFRKTGDSKVLKSLNNAVDFFHKLQHPDGTIGGEYASRFTYIFHPNGFEILADKNHKAREIANSYLSAKTKDLIPNIADDYIIGHALISSLNAYRNCLVRDFNVLNSSNKECSDYFEKSGFYLYKKNNIHAVFNMYKGGCGKIFKDNKLVYNDAGVILQTGKQLAVSSMINFDSKITINEAGFEISKNFNLYKQQYAKLLIFLAFRSFLFVFGPFDWSSRLLRKFLQRKMITGKKNLPIEYHRKVAFTEIGIELITRVKKGNGLKKIALASDLVPIYTAVSECFQKDMIKHNWKDFELINNEYLLEEKIR